MKLLLKSALLLLILLLPFSSKANEQISKEKLESQGKQRTYYLYVPESTKTSTAVSLVVLLHGSGRNGLSLVEKWKDLASQEGFIIVGPDAANSSGWRTPDDAPEFLHDLVEMLIKKYPIEPHHLYLFGHSAGAVFALSLAMLESEYFAAVAIHAGAWRSQQEYSVIDKARRKVPLKIIVGDRDSSFPLESVKKTEEALKARGFPIDVTIIKGHDHWYYDLAPDINRNAWEFLKQNALAADRRHVQFSSTAVSKDLNSALKEINALRLRADDAVSRFYAKEDELRVKDYVRDKVAVSEIARTQIQILTEGARGFRDAATAAERTSKMKIAPNHQEYFSLLGVASLKRAESLELLIKRAELLLSDEELNSINTKRGELVKQANSLNDEAAELEKKAQALVGG